MHKLESNTTLTFGFIPKNNSMGEVSHPRKGAGVDSSPQKQL